MKTHLLPGLLVIAAAVLFGHPTELKAQTACYSCQWSSTSGDAVCNPISPNGGNKICKAAPKSEVCSQSGESCTTEVSILDMAPDGALLAVREAPSDPQASADAVGGGPVVHRRLCDGVIVRRLTTALSAHRVREQSRHVVI